MPLSFYLRLAYDGTTFHGWQIQSTLPTVQGEVWRALRKLEPEAPMPQGTGRTDSGVHAEAQGTVVRVERPWEPYRLLAALNAHLPPTIRVMEAVQVPEAFYPRRHAVAKRYRYRIGLGPTFHPLERAIRWQLFRKEALDQEAMRAAAAVWVGTHDYSAFRHQECEAEHPVRTIHAIRLEPHPMGLDLLFEGSAFLMHQVRIMSGTLVGVGKGKIAAADALPILESRDRTRAGETAPAHGLCMEKVWYEARWGLNEPSPWGEGPEPDRE
ncbi:MAG TPA: tRNA pseudouridine(38-40) synthase TruA [Holophagaceae bacterium]|nr:tRNA pseudouridine(38-40) synthase TruA [Holophagaceae bacterium]